MTKSLRSRRTRLAWITVLLGVGLATSASSLFPIELTVRGACVVNPQASWTLREVRPGSYESKATDHVSGEVLHYRIYQFDRPAFLDLDFAGMKAAAGERCEPGQVVANIRSSTLSVEFAERSTALAGARGTLSSLQAGAKPERIDAARIALRQAEAERHAYALYAERQRALLGEGLITQERWEEVDATLRLRGLDVRLAEAQLEVLKSSAGSDRIAAAKMIVDGLEREIRALEEMMSAQEIRAPIGGRLRLGGAEGALLSVTKPDSVVIEILVPQDRAGRLAVGQSVRVLVPGISVAIPEGSVVRVDRRPLHATAGPFVRLYALFDNGSGALEEQMQGRASIACGSASAASLMWADLVRALQREMFAI